MKFINSPFAILEKRIKAFDYQKRNLYIRNFLEEEEIINAHLITLFNKSLKINSFYKLP